MRHSFENHFSNQVKVAAVHQDLGVSPVDSDLPRSAIKVSGCDGAVASREPF
jgi:hypothetical protein